MDTNRPDWLGSSEYPFEVEYWDGPRGPVAYIDQGEGPVLLFVHVGMWSFVFRDLILRLQDRYRCIAMDLPGFGLAAHAGIELEAQHLVDALDGFVESRVADTYTLVAHDLGGVIGLAAAARQVERVAGLVLINTFAWTPDTWGLRAMLRVMGGKTMAAVGSLTNLIPALTSTRFGVGRHLDAEGRRAFLGPFRDRAVRRRFHGAMRTVLDNPSLTDEVARAVAGSLNALPVLTVFGSANDPFGFQLRHAKTFGDHTGLVVQGGNHFPMMDDPDQVATVLARWHREKLGASGPKVDVGS